MNGLNNGMGTLNCSIYHSGGLILMDLLDDYKGTICLRIGITPERFGPAELIII